MLDYEHAFAELADGLQKLYGRREAEAISDDLLWHLSGKTRSQRRQYKDVSMPQELEQIFYSSKEKLIKGIPLQYVTRSAWFMGREYHVNEHVLIPRPETEELVKWVIDDRSKFQTPGSNLLDIGTGSGCISISLKLVLTGVGIIGCDISNDALAVAKQNAEALHADVKFLQVDFLNVSQHNKLADYDVIVSNPPYIPAAEEKNMHTNVKDHEPHIALFVPDGDPLVFYRAIASFGKQHLKTNGYIYCELDAGHALQCRSLFEEAGYNVEIRKDMHGNWRMLKAWAN